MMRAPMTAPKLSLIEQLARLDDRQLQRVLASLSAPQRRELNERWRQWAHYGQYPDDSDWRIWLIQAGRGYGKTRAGAEWVSALARGGAALRIALVGATIDDVRKVMIEGESGLINVARVGEAVTWRPATGEVHFPSGATAHAYSAEGCEKLRGPEHHYAWCDEIAKWNNGNKTWDNLMLGLRLGDHPRVLVTTTPKPVPLLRRLRALDRIEVRGGSTQENHNLPPDFVAMVEGMYGGTRLGRQELDGELIDDVEGALWTRDMLEARRVSSAPQMKRIIVGVDPPAGTNGDACGIVVVGLGANDHVYILADCSVSGKSPEGWARAVAVAAELWQADRVVAEGNQGGAMVESTLRGADVAMPIKRVFASVGKVARAEPILALYESGRAWHVGSFPALEDELCGLIRGGTYAGPGRSPDRADALVWAVTELMLGGVRVPRVRGM
jgi:phage terminase large subunit-like protein